MIKTFYFGGGEVRFKSVLTQKQELATYSTENVKKRQMHLK